MSLLKVGMRWQLRRARSWPDSLLSFAEVILGLYIFIISQVTSSGEEGSTTAESGDYYYYEVGSALFLHLQCENKNPCFKTFRGLDRKMVLSMCKPLSYLKNSRSQDQGQEQQKERQRKTFRSQAGLLDHPLRRQQLCSGFLTDFINDSEQNWYNIWHPVELEYILHEQQIPRNDHKRWYSSFSPELNSIKLSILMQKLHKWWHFSSSASPLFPFCRCHNRILSLRFIFAENQNTLIIWQMRFHGIIADSFN